MTAGARKGSAGRSWSITSYLISKERRSRRALIIGKIRPLTGDPTSHRKVRTKKPCLLLANGATEECGANLVRGDSSAIPGYAGFFVNIDIGSAVCFSALPGPIWSAPSGCGFGSSESRFTAFRLNSSCGFRYLRVVSRSLCPINFCTVTISAPSSRSRVA